VPFVDREVEDARLAAANIPTITTAAASRTDTSPDPEAVRRRMGNTRVSPRSGRAMPARSRPGGCVGLWLETGLLSRPVRERAAPSLRHVCRRRPPLARSPSPKGWFSPPSGPKKATALADCVRGVQHGPVNAFVVAWGLLLPESTLDAQWFRVLAAFVAVNTLVYLTLSISKSLPWSPGDRRPRRYARGETRSIHPDGPR
jgi:hypothetical protein